VGSSSSSTPIAPVPEPNDNWKERKSPRTYADPPETDLGKPGRPTGSGASQLKQEDERPFDKPRIGDDSDGSDEQGGTSSASGVKSDSNSSKASKKGPAAPKANDENPGSSRIPTISVDDKVAWRTPPARSRMETRPRTVSARIVRLPAYPKSDWLPVEGESKVAQK
jgi:hypothetical protein